VWFRQRLPNQLSALISCGQDAAMAHDPATVLDSLASNPQLRGFIGARRIDTMPARRSRRRQLLAEVAQIFEPGIRYSEPAVNDLLRSLYPDCAALRRYLVDEEFMDRAAGVYWRIGGPDWPAA
jgi:hypothetical protein